MVSAAVPVQDVELVLVVVDPLRDVLAADVPLVAVAARAQASADAAVRVQASVDAARSLPSADVSQRASVDVERAQASADAAVRVQASADAVSHVVRESADTQRPTAAVKRESLASEEDTVSEPSLVECLTAFSRCKDHTEQLASDVNSESARTRSTKFTNADIQNLK